MSKLLRADFLRLRKSFAFRLTLFAMLLLAGAFLFMQATAMDYTVPLTRVVFLPLSMFGIAMAALVSSFVGTDYSDGFIRNKLLTSTRRSDYVISQIIISCFACFVAYLVVTAFTFGIGLFIFEDNVDRPELFRYFLLGIVMSVTTGCIFSAITVLSGNKARAVICCMGLAFAMLFLALHTNEVLLQSGLEDGFRKTANELLHDLNPCGQAAQLSSWEVGHPLRILLINILLICGSSGLACALFQRKNIN